LDDIFNELGVSANDAGMLRTSKGLYDFKGNKITNIDDLQTHFVKYADDVQAKQILDRAKVKRKQTLPAETAIADIGAPASKTINDFPDAPDVTVVGESQYFDYFKTKVDKKTIDLVDSFIIYVKFTAYRFTFSFYECYCRGYI